MTVAELIDKLPEYTARPYPNYPTYDDLINKINELIEVYNKSIENDIYGKCNGCVNDECESCCRWDKHADCYESEVTV